MRDPKVFYLMQRAHSALFRAADRYLKSKVGLSSSQHAVLLALTKNDGMPISVIASQLNLGKSSLTGLIDRMSSKGLVRREQSEKDARSFSVHIEDEGRMLVEATIKGTKRINRELLSPFSIEERATIGRFLEHLAHNAGDIVRMNPSKTSKSKESTPA
ncbi:MAG: MarR family winged helix-turn-helix transcriptional regulator [Parasphingorhabdus sp.]